MQSDQKDSVLKKTLKELFSLTFYGFDIYECATSMISSILTIPTTAVAGLIYGLLHDKQVSENFAKTNKLLFYQRVFVVFEEYNKLQQVLSGYGGKNLIETTFNGKPLHEIILNDENLESIKDTIKQQNKNIKPIEYIQGLDKISRTTLSNVIENLCTSEELSEEKKYQLFLDTFKKSIKKHSINPDKEIQKLIKEKLNVKSKDLKHINNIANEFELKIFNFFRDFSLKLREILKIVIQSSTFENKNIKLIVHLLNLAVLLPIYALFATKKITSKLFFKTQKILKLFTLGVLSKMLNNNKTQESKTFNKASSEFKSGFNSILSNINMSYSEEKGSVLQVLEKSIAESIFAIHLIWNKDDYNKGVMDFVSQTLEDIEKDLKNQEIEGDLPTAEYYFMRVEDCFATLKTIKSNDSLNLAQHNPIGSIRALAETFESCGNRIVVACGKKAAKSAQKFCDFVAKDNNQLCVTNI